MMKYEKMNSNTSTSPSHALKSASLRQSFPSSSSISPTSQRGNIFNYNGIITTPTSNTNKKFQLNSGNISNKKIKSDLFFSPMSTEQKEKEIEKIKLKTQEIDHEKTLLRIKTAKMRRTISDRNQSINKVFTAPSKDEQFLKTTSNTMMAKLKRNFDNLQDEKKILENELYACENSDNYWISNELLIEVRTLFEDQERLKDIVSEVRKAEQEIVNNERDAKIAISKSSINEIETEMVDINQSITELQKKCSSYDRGKSKARNATLLSNIQDKKMTIEDAIHQIQNEIRDLETQIKCNKLAMKNAEKSTDDAMEHLYIIYNDAILKIEEAIKKKKQSIEIDQNPQFQNTNMSAD